MEVTKILASYFYTDEGVVKKCAADTAQLEGIDQDTVYSYVIDMIGHTETLPRDIVVSSFNLLPPDQFVKVCQLSVDYHSLCETPALWLVYLRARPQKDWDVIIKHILGVEYPPRVLERVLQQYMQLYPTSAIDLAFRVADTYDLDSLYEMIFKRKILAHAGRDKLDEFEDSIEKLTAALVPLPKNIDVLAREVLTERPNYLCYMSWFGRYIPSIHKTTNRQDLAHVENQIKLVKTYFYTSFGGGNIIMLSLAHYFTRVKDIIDVEPMLYTCTDDLLTMEQCIVNDGYNFMNSTLARDILSRDPTILQHRYIITDAKKHIKILVGI
jgi:hypothetical protein